MDRAPDTPPPPHPRAASFRFLQDVAPELVFYISFYPQKTAHQEEHLGGERSFEHVQSAFSFPATKRGRE